MKKIQMNRGIIVGIFIFIGIAILVTAVFTLGGQQKTFVRTFTVKTVFDDVGGLQIGNNIWFSGVKIGTVKRVEFYGTSQVEVTMHIEKKVEARIRKDAKVKLGSDGLIGNKILIIYDGTPKAGEVQDGDYLQGDKAMNTEEMLAVLQENNKNLLAITGDFKNISKKIVDGEGSVGSLINDATLANDLKATVANFKTASVASQKLIANLNNSISNLNSFTAKLNDKGTLANDLVSDTLIFKSLRGTAAQLREASNTASRFADDLKTASAGLNKTDNTIGVLLNDQKVASDLKATVSNLKSGSEKLDENLEALQHNFLLRGFFKKKAKKEAEATQVKEEVK